MADGQKLILGVGDYFAVDNFKDCIKIVNEKRIILDKRAMDVTEAMDAINSGKYWGVFMHSLVLPTGREVDKYNEAARKFEEFDNPPNIWRSGGLYVVEQACNKGLITVVNGVSEDKDDLAEASRLGAECFSVFGEGMNHNCLKQTLEYFQSRL